MKQSATIMLCVTCPKCRTPYRSALKMDAATFEEVILVTMIERCGSCGHAGRFDRRDYYFADAYPSQSVPND